MTIINKSENLTVKETYALTMNSAIQKMTTIKGQTIEVNKWALYRDEDSDGKEQEILSIMTYENEVYATNSQTFIRDFIKMWDMFAAGGERVDKVTVASGVSKGGRDFITCAYPLD